jgi:chorismate mutase
MMRGIRGATTVATDTPEAIAEATLEMLGSITRLNDVRTGDIAAATFSTTADVCSAFPATSARAMGWTLVPMLCHHEIDVPGSLARCIRVLVLWNTERGPDEIRHVYLRDAVILRPDLAPASITNHPQLEN